MLEVVVIRPPEVAETKGGISIRCHLGGGGVEVYAYV